MMEVEMDIDAGPLNPELRSPDGACGFEPALSPPEAGKTLIIPVSGVSSFRLPC
jgi:hypothetical protein